MQARPANTYDGNISLFRCDQCAHHRSYCDKQLPSCGRCISRNVSCTLTRTIKVKRHRQPQIEIRQTQFKLDSYAKKPAKAARTLCSDSPINGEDFILMKRGVVTNTVKLSLNTLREILGAIKNKPVGYNLFSMLEQPTSLVPNPGLSIFIASSAKLRLLAFSSYKPPKIIKLDCVTIEFWKFIIEGVNAYFEFINPYLFLFSKKSFFQKQRSAFLILTLSLSGHRFLKGDLAEDTMFRYLDSMTYTLFKKDFLVPTFSNLQAYVVLCFDISTCIWVNFNSTYFLGLITNFAMLLGLHHNPKTLDEEDRIERCLATNLIRHITSMNGHNFRSISYELSLDSNFSFFPYNLMENENLFDAVDFTSVIISCFFSKVSPILCEVNQYRHYSMIGKESLSNIRVKVKVLSEKLQQIALENLKALYSIQHKSTKYLLIHTNMMIAFLNIAFHFNLFRINSLVLYTLPRNNSLEKLPEVSNALTACAQVLIGCSQIPHKHHFTFHVTMIGQCLVFLIRYQKVHPDQLRIHKAIEFGYALLTSMQDYPRLSHISKMNLFVPDIVKSLAQP